MLEFWQNLVRKRDFYAGALLVLLGLLAVDKGPAYGIGTLMSMGAGFMPTALGIVLIALGVVIAGTATALPAGEGENILPDNPQWWGWSCILGGPVLFLVFAKFGGLLPAAFACVFVAALGDREATVRSAFALAAIVTVFGVVLFAFFLGIAMPVWGPS